MEYIEISRLYLFIFSQIVQISLKMTIDKLELRNFKNFETLEVEFVSGINLLVGSNGSGKTSILEAVNIAMGGFFGEQEPKMQRTIHADEARLYVEGLKPKRANKTTITARSALIREPWTRNYNPVTNRNDSQSVRPAALYGKRIIDGFLEPTDFSVAPLLAYYSTQRLFKDASRSAKQKYDAAAGRRNGYLQCLEADSIKGTLSEWLGNAVTRRATKQIQGIDATDLVLQNVEQAIKTTLAHCFEEFNERDLKIYQEPDFGFEVFIQIDEHSSLPISYYSDGFRNLVYLTIDLIWRASQLNPWLDLGRLQREQNGVVTIDEIDLHLHPKWQAKALTLLQTLLPNVQFFVTTHSPTVVANFRERTDEATRQQKDALYVLTDNSCGKVTASFYGRDINTVLGNPMDAHQRAPEVKADIDRFDRIVSDPASTDEDYVAATQIAHRLNQILPGTDRALIHINEIVSRIQHQQKEHAVY